MSDSEKCTNLEIMKLAKCLQILNLFLYNEKLILQNKQKWLFYYLLISINIIVNIKTSINNKKY